ncbi:MAG: hypothetical protein J6Y89_03355 [Lachnospiraceae bacterium]|nr:hypothetical protein [Lachnospiraceae bacterium]
MTSLEAARSAAAGAFARMLLVCAAESEAAEFYRPLFEEYHLFGIDTGFGGSAGNISEVARGIAGRIPQNIWKIENKECTLTDHEMMMDGTGDIFIEQAVKYELLSKAGNLLSGFAEKLGMISGQEKTAKVLQKKLESEEKIAKIDELTLDLMKMIDGVNCNLSGDGSARYTIETGFVKRFLNMPVSMHSAQINSNEVFAALSGRYVNPVEMLEELYILAGRYAEALAEEEQCAARIEELEAEERVIRAELNLAKDALAAVYGVMETRITVLYLAAEDDGPDATPEEKEEKERELARKAEEIRQEYSEEISFCEARITRSETELTEAEAKISEERKKLEKYRLAVAEKYEPVREKADMLTALFGETASYVQNALVCIMKIKTARAEAEPGVDEYEQELEKAKSNIDPEILEGYEEDHDRMKEYIEGIGGNSAFDFELAEASLRKDKNLLEECGYERLLVFSGMDSRAVTEAAKELLWLKDRVGEFVYDGFVFDYSSFSNNSGTGETASGGLLSGIGESFLSLMIKDTESMSNAELTSALLPGRADDMQESASGSRADNRQESTSDGNADNRQESTSDSNADSGQKASSNTLQTQIPELQDTSNGAASMAGAIGGSDISEVSDLADSVSAENGTTDGDYSGLSPIMRSVGFILYLADNFGCYTESLLTEDTVMKYEQEYIIAGNFQDKENLSSAVLRILLLRLVTSGIYVFSNSDLNSRAELIATGILGFTGMPFLVAFAKYVILFACSLEQAMIETAALLSQKAVTVVTKDEGFLADIGDIISFSAGTIASKAEAYPRIENGIRYSDYMCILMMLTDRKTAAYRALDLIQENLRYEYDEDYLMINCLTGFSVNAYFDVSPMFINFNGYRISTSYGIRY